jgi:DNA-binding protein HU-beta
VAKLTKTDLINAVSESSGLSKKDSAAAVFATLEAIQKALIKGEKIEFIISNFLATESEEEGVNMENIEASYKNDVLEIIMPESKEEDWVDIENIEASYKNGVLEIIMPESEKEDEVNTRKRKASGDYEDSCEETAEAEPTGEETAEAEPTGTGEGRPW